MIDKGKRTSEINTWRPNSKQTIVEQDGKLFICHFDKVLHNESLKGFNTFCIKKGSYENQLDIITQYINFFIAKYDTDNELVTAYLAIKYAVDKDKRFKEENMNAYISFLYETIFTDTVVDKIKRMVEENYLDDIETDSEEKKRKYQKNEKKHLESLEFTNQHIKILLCISFAMKIMCPAMLHYHALNVIKIEKDSDNIFRFYKPLFDIFSVVKKHDDQAHVTDDGYFYIKNTSTNYYDKYDDNTGELVMPNISETVVDDKRAMGGILLKPRDYYAHYDLYNKLFVYVKILASRYLVSGKPL